MQNIIDFFCRFVDFNLNTIVDLPNLLPSTPFIFSLIHNVQIGNVLGKFHHFNGCHRNPLRPMSSNVTELSRGKNFCVDFFVLDFHHNQRQIFSQKVHFLPRFGISKRKPFPISLLLYLLYIQRLVSSNQYVKLKMLNSFNLSLFKLRMSKMHNF